MNHDEEVRGLTAKEMSFVELENLKITICGHLFKLSEFVNV